MTDKQADYTIRAMTPDDVPEVLAIEEDVHVSPWTDGIFRDCLRVGYLSQVMVHEGEIVGYIVMSSVAGEAHLFNIVVRRDYQGLGLGRVLMKHVFDMARKLNAKSIFLEVRPSNFAAINLYTSLGFDEVGIRKDYYPTPRGREDALIFAMEL